MHDPSVIKVGSCYYGFSTGFENDPLNPSGSITLRKTCAGTAASGWTKVGNVWSSTPSWITAKLGSTPPNIWAPDIKYFNGVYHLYYAGSL
ncbi:family 43 glycosylhydrolase [Streptomyces sp. NPDC020489]